MDPRLIRYASATRRYLAFSVGVGVAQALLLLAQAWLLATIIARGIAGGGLAGVTEPASWLVVVVLARAGLAWGAERAAHRAAAEAKSELRRRLAAKVVALGATGLGRDRAGSLAQLATSGIDDLDAYFARYLPQVLLAVIVPVAVIATVAGADPLTALILALTVPLVPLFMVLVGLTTRDAMSRRMATLDRLAGRFVDLVAGLPTLKIFNRARAQAATVARVGERYREATMATLRLAFLSSLVLELLATISVAVVAVAVGLRLLAGELDLQTAFFALIAAPEAFLPLRALGASYHSSAAGVAAAAQVFDVLDRPEPTPGRLAPPALREATITFAGVEVAYDGAATPQVGPVSFSVAPGEVVVLTGPSGAGKSTLLACLLGLCTPTAGAVTIGGVAVEQLDLEAYHRQVAWVPQRPLLFPGTVADNVALGLEGIGPDAIDAAMAAAGLDAVLARLPRGRASVLGSDGAGLSVGERQRVALARALVRDVPLVLLDEPTAALDAETERALIEVTLPALRGRTVVMVAHRSALVAVADRVVPVSMRVAP